MRSGGGISLAICLGLWAGAGQANAPDQSLRPVVRAGSEPVVAVQPDTTQEVSTEKSAKKKQRKGLFRALRPKKRSKKVGLFASKKKRELARGAVCGDTALQGEPVGHVPGKISGCGVADAIKLRSVSGVALSQRSVMDCGTAKALKRWVDGGLKPAVGRRGGGAAKIKVAAHYSCRTRNNKKGARISEHGKGRAIDISAVYLADGSELSVLKHWGQGWRGKALKKMHKVACGPFGTVLGPNADRYHRDHFHFDTARYRSGSYCK
ncbi:extensin family protein [Alisedimentitalea sp. MJ-SS2]|uniref:extensin-like domain-containing protein n=1 Tax=Aliisedimentitalea sp. MJ-SS2 TaxID=3049795 RepID=UPI00290D1881|nr:extensin family protein [Alisedimentitalea sp. MJ-SS2]MDU8927176.1 extensin family protein [Alisedimentitalea sp. MJ-SS2]